METALTQMCNRHAIRAKINKASKQAKGRECLPCERLVQGKRHVGKKAEQCPRGLFAENENFGAKCL